MRQDSQYSPRPALATIRDDESPTGFAFEPVPCWDTGSISNDHDCPYFTPEQAAALCTVLNGTPALLAPGTEARITSGYLHVRWAGVERTWGTPVLAAQPEQGWPTEVYAPFHSDVYWLIVPDPDYHRAE